MITFKPYSKELDDNSGHVVTANASRGGHARGDYFIKHLANYCGRLIGSIVDLVYSLVDEISCLLVGQAVPDSITGEENELYFRADVVGLYFRNAGDHLIFRLKIRILLVLEISERPGEI